MKGGGKGREGSAWSGEVGEMQEMEDKVRVKGGERRGGGKGRGGRGRGKRLARLPEAGRGKEKARR